MFGGNGICLCVRRGAPSGCIGMVRVAPGVVAELLRPGLTMLRPFGVLLRGLSVDIDFMWMLLCGSSTGVCRICLLLVGSSVGVGHTCVLLRGSSVGVGHTCVLLRGSSASACLLL